MDMQLFVQPLLGFLFIGGIIGTIFWIVTSIFWLWMLVDCITNASLRGVEKIIWLLVVIFLHFLGALLYFFIARGGRASAPRI